MNERIRELATEVGISVEYLTNTKQIELIEKFALLIVQDCIGIVDILPNCYHDDRDAIENEFREDCINTMKKHFGVEE